MKRSSRVVRAVWRKEFFSAAASPAAWVFLVIFLELSAFLSFIVSGLFSYGQADMEPFFRWLPWLFLFIVPSLGMPLWAEERRTGTFELSLSFPATLRELVTGKFLAGLTQLGIALLLTASIPLTALYLGQPDTGAIFCGYVGAFLLGGICLAVSCFCSSLTHSQTASFLLSLVICTVFMTAGAPEVLEAASLYLPDPLVNVLAYMAFLPHYQSFQRGFIDSSDLVYFFSTTLFFLYLAERSLAFAAAGTGNLFAPGALAERSTRRAIRSLLGGILLALYALVCLNLGGSAFQFKADMSTDGAYSLSPEAKAFAANLKTPAVIRFYASTSSSQMPAGFKHYAERIQWLLRSLCEASHGKLTLQVLDPEPDSEDEQAAYLEGITPVSINTGDRVYMGLSVSSGDKCLAIPFLSLQGERLLEYDIIRTILNTTSRERPKIGVMSAFNVMGTPVASGLQHFDADKPKVFEHSWYVISELAADYDLVRVPLDAAEIPADLSALLVIHPAGITERGLYALDQYLMRGGKMAVFLDPRSFYAMIKMKQDFSMSEKITSSLKPLTDAWGISWNPDIIVADLVYAHRRMLPDRMVSNPSAMELNGDAISRKTPLTSMLQSLAMWFTAPLEINPPHGLKAEVLLATSPSSQLVSAFIAERPELVLRNFKPSGKSIPLALRLSGKFPGAYPKGAPLVTGKPHLASSSGDGVVFLFGDSDMLFNDLCVRTANDAYGQKTLIRLNDNAALLLNIMEQLSRTDNSLAKISGRNPMSRPLTKYNEIRARAELTYKNRIQDLERDLRLSEQKVKMIQNEVKTSASGTVELTPEQRAQLRDYSFKLSQIKRELKEVRLKLRADMNRIDTILRIVNMVFVPLLVALTGILWAFARFSKWRKRS